MARPTAAVHMVSIKGLLFKMSRMQDGSIIRDQRRLMTLMSPFINSYILAGHDSPPKLFYYLHLWPYLFQKSHWAVTELVRTEVIKSDIHVYTYIAKAWHHQQSSNLKATPPSLSTHWISRLPYYNGRLTH